jgi:hypothetical protein
MSDAIHASEQFMSLDQGALMSGSYAPNSVLEHAEAAKHFEAFSKSMIPVLDMATKVVAECRKRKLDNAELEGGNTVLKTKIETLEKVIADLEVKNKNLEEACKVYEVILSSKCGNA